MCKIVSQCEPAAWHGELILVLCDDLMRWDGEGGREIKEGWVYVQVQLIDFVVQQELAQQIFFFKEGLTKLIRTDNFLLVLNFEKHFLCVCVCMCVCVSFHQSRKNVLYRAFSKAAKMFLISQTTLSNSQGYILIISFIENFSWLWVWGYFICFQ